jgi:hypothetical protein
MIGGDTSAPAAGAPWCLSHRADPVARALADRHYSRQTPGAVQFVPPGRCAVFVTSCARAYWVTSWPFSEYVKHAWAGAWVCSAFRSEGAGVASNLIRAAISCTRWQLGEPPALGMVTFIDRAKVRPVKVRGRETWGRAWRLAGFRDCGETAGGLLALRLAPEDMPAAAPPASQPSHTLPLFGGAA